MADQDDAAQAGSQSTQGDDQGGAQTHPFAGLLTGAQVHDAIMAPIEPDLTTQNVVHLDQKYQGESTEQRRSRVARYKDAMSKFDSAFGTWAQNVGKTVSGYKEEAMARAVAQSGQEDAGAMANLEQAFGSDT